MVKGFGSHSNDLCIVRRRQPCGAEYSQTSAPTSPCGDDNQGAVDLLEPNAYGLVVGCGQRACEFMQDVCSQGGFASTRPY